ncbi:uncharacterized protein LOC135149310 [Daucus carota subsp. sativus]|uniref:uncharacterized protein LOC135149310 n=1 Tax=Daucus carota subsp. sativus TaxID=79200 RepID=UPI003082CE94
MMEALMKRVLVLKVLVFLNMRVQRNAAGLQLMGVYKTVIWVDKKSQQTYETFLTLCELHEKAGEPVDKNAIFLQAAGGVDKKKRVYGVGSSQSLFYRSKTIPCSSSFADAENQKLQEELKVMKEKMKAMENQIAKILEATSAAAQVTQSPTTPNTDLDSENGVE